jgi:type IX secretion system PorP/SprF family membrane protein
MTKKARILLCLVLLLWGRVLHAQYFQYTQYNFTQQRVNPAMLGLSRYASASLDYRHQKTGGDFSINSNFVSLAYPLLQSSTGQPWSGVGITLHNDQSAGIFKTQEAAVSYAIHVRLSRWQTLSIGMKGLLQTRKISMDGFYTGAQYVPDRGFDPSFSSGENFLELRTTYKTFSTGVYWQETDKKGRLLHHFGFSIFDFNKPEDSFFGASSQLSSTFVLNGGFEALSNNDIHLFPEALLTYSASNPMLNTGVRVQKELNPKSKALSDRVEVLAKYAVGRSGIVGIQLHRENFSMGLSYDFPLFRLNAGNVGALEVALEWRRLVPTRAQKLTAKRKKATEEKQKEIAKKTPQKEAKPKETENTIVAEVKPDSVSTPIPPVEIIQVDSSATALTTHAQAGQLKQEPLIVERVTLHFPFEFNSADLDDPTEEFLSDLVTTLKDNENLKLKIEGHTDNIGSDKFNLRLSQKRADAVRHHIIKSGISADRLSSEGKGKHEPLNENLTDQERAKNRRVEITVYY